MQYFIHNTILADYYNGYLVDKGVFDKDTNPAVKLVTAAGYTEVISIVDIDKYSFIIVDNSDAINSDIRASLIALYTAAFSTYTAPEKTILSKWFVASKADRDTIDSATVQANNAYNLSVKLQLDSVDNLINGNTTAIKDAEPTAVTSTVAETSLPTIQEAPNDGQEYVRKSLAWAVKTGGGLNFKEFASADMATLASTTKTYLSSSGREFTAHSGTGSSNNVCGCTFTLDNWVSGGKLQIYCTTGPDGVKYFKYYIVATIWDGTTKTQETLTFNKTLTAAASTYPQLKTNEITLSAGLLAAMGNGKTITFKIGRDASDVEDDYNSACYTELLTFKYNY